VFAQFSPRATTAAAKLLAVSVFCLVLTRGSLCSAQAQAQPQKNQTKSAKLDEPGKPSSESPAEAGSKNAETAPDPGISSSDIAKELAVMKARIEQLEVENLEGRRLATNGLHGSRLVNWM